MEIYMTKYKIMLTINEASEYTGIGRNTLRTLIHWDLIPVIKIGKKTLIRAEMLDKFIKLNEGKNLKNRFELIAI